MKLIFSTFIVHDKAQVYFSDIKPTGTNLNGVTVKTTIIS